jgi:hypothetical protein
MRRYEILMHSSDAEQHVVIHCKNRKHAIELFRLLKKAELEMVSDMCGDEVTETLEGPFIHGYGKMFGKDNLWIELGDTWPNKRRIDFTNPEANFEHIDSVKL